MMATPTVILIGANKGGVGKTTVGREVVNYLTAQGIPLRAFDTGGSKGDLLSLPPLKTGIVYRTEVPGQMRIFNDVAESTSPSLTCAPAAVLGGASPCADVGILDWAKRDNSLSLSFIFLAWAPL